MVWKTTLFHISSMLNIFNLYGGNKRIKSLILASIYCPDLAQQSVLALFLTELSKLKFFMKILFQYVEGTYKYNNFRLEL